MQTIKTGVVIALLIAVCYGAFIALNAPEADIPDSIQEWANATELDDLAIDVDLGFDLGAVQSATPETLAGGYGLPGNADSNAGNSQVPSGSIAFPDVSLPQLPESGATTLGSTSMPEFPTTAELSQAASPNAASRVGSLDVDIDLPHMGTDGPSVPFDVNSTSLPKGDFVSTNIPLPDASTFQGPDVNSMNNRDLSGAGQPGLPSTLPLLDSTEATKDSASSGAVKSTMPVMPFEIARQQALLKADAGELTEALRMLSPFYNSPDIDYKEHEDLLDILDALSRHAIYSSSYMLEPAYTVTANDSIATIAEKHRITPELLSDINGLGAGKTLSPGSTLKVINGPFRAQIQLRRRQLAVFIGDLYAGRFDIEIGSDPTPTPGVYEVDDRRRDRTYYAAGGAVIQASEAKNPYGGFWISLGGNLSIHGSPSIDAPELQNAGCIGLAPIDAQHVYNMLIKHSQVEVVP